MIKILFHANDYEGLKSYAKILNKVSPDVSIDWIYDRDLFLEKVRNDYDLIFLVVLNYTEDLLILKEIYNLNKDIPIILIVKDIDSIKKNLSLVNSKNVVEIIPEKEFFDQPLTNLNFRIIKSIRVVKGKGELIKIIERGQKFWLTVFDNLPELALIIDEEGIIVSCNKPLSSVFNKHPRELIGKKAKEIINFNFIHNFDTKSLPDYLEEEYDGKYFYITTTKFNFENRLNILLFFKDITEYKKIKEHLFQKDKYTSIGTLASGIAHEINNPLTGIIGFTQMLKMQSGCNQHTETLDKILECADRCKKIVESLLIYSRQKPSSRTLEVINNIVERTIDLVGYNLKKSNIKLNVDLGNVPVMLLDAQQIQQVLINIILNAQEAILKAKRQRGEILIKTNFDEKVRKVYISISDNGCGIPENIKHKIFDPFFTTKPFGEAMGLGLSIAYGIVKEHNGNISFESKEDVGTTFVIELPVEL